MPLAWSKQIFDIDLELDSGFAGTSMVNPYHNPRLTMISTVRAQIGPHCAISNPIALPGIRGLSIELQPLSNCQRIR